MLIKTKKKTSEHDKHNHNNDIQLEGRSTVLSEVVRDFKFLDILFDCSLSVISHIKYLVNKCQKVLNLLGVVSHTKEVSLLQSSLFHKKHF